MSTQTETQTEESHNNYGRRAFLRRSAAATTAAVGVGAGAHHMGTQPIGSVSASSLQWRVGAKTAADSLKYLADEVDDLLLGDERDYSNYTGADALHTEIETGAREMQSTNERVMTSIDNNAANSENVALAKGKAALLEAMNDEEDESTATDAMDDAIDEYYSKIQKNLVTHIEAQTDQWVHFAEQVETHDDLVEDDVLAHGGGGISHYHVIDGEVELINGETFQFDALFIDTNDNGGHYNEQIAFPNVDEFSYDDSEFEESYEGAVDPAVKSVDDELDKIVIHDPVQAEDVWKAIIDSKDSVYSTLSGFASDVYAEYEPGDIPIEDLVDPITAATELSQDYDGEQGNLAYASMLGIPTNAQASVFIDVIEGGTTEYFDEDDYENATNVSDLDGNESNETLVGIAQEEAPEIEADLFTEHVPENSDGEEVGFETGEFYDPNEWGEPLYIAYENIYEDDEGEVVEESDFVQLEDPFVVVSAENKDGEEVDSFENSSQNTQTADIEKLEEEIEQIREERNRLQEESQDSGGGGLFDFGGSDLQTYGIIGLLLVLAGGFLTN